MNKKSNSVGYIQFNNLHQTRIFGFFKKTKQIEEQTRIEIIS